MQKKKLPQPQNSVFLLFCSCRDMKYSAGAQIPAPLCYSQQHCPQDGREESWRMRFGDVWGGRQRFHASLCLQTQTSWFGLSLIPPPGFGLAQWWTRSYQEICESARSDGLHHLLRGGEKQRAERLWVFVVPLHITNVFCCPPEQVRGSLLLFLKSESQWGFVLSRWRIQNFQMTLYRTPD